MEKITDYRIEKERDDYGRTFWAVYEGDATMWISAHHTQKEAEAAVELLLAAIPVDDLEIPDFLRRVRQ